MRTLRIPRLAVTGAVVAACLSAPTHAPGSLVAASVPDDDAPSLAAPTPVVVPELPAAPVVEESTAGAVRRPVLGRSGLNVSADHSEIPSVALSAYQRAATVITAVDPDCGLTWSLLAAVGSIESDHGRYGGAVLGQDGVSQPLVLGPVLDGRGAVAAVPDTDGGTVDGNTRWDRAVGPMQMLPSTWAAVGVDADGDGKRSADDIDDAALGAAVYLCGAPGNLDSAAGLREALLRYNPSASYADAVTALERDYRTGAAALPGSGIDAVAVAVGPPVLPAPGTVGGDPTGAGEAGIGTAKHAGASIDDTTKHPDKPKHGKGDHGGKGTQGGQGGQGTKPGTTPTDPTDPVEPTDPGDPTEPTDPTDPTEPTDPEPSTDPTTEPEPEPTTEQLSGTLTQCGAGAWCVGGTAIDVGGADVLGAAAAADLDGDGTVETNGDELAGLVGTTVTVTVSVPEGEGLPVLLRIGQVAYRD